MDEYYDRWRDVKTVEDVPTFGFRYAVGLEPVNVNTDAMIEKFVLGVKQLGPLWEAFLPEGVIWFLTSMSENGKNKFRFPDEIWVETICNFALAYHQKVMHHEHIIKSLTPLYIGKVAAFVLETWEMSSGEVEERLESLCKVFMQFKDYLIERWQ